MLAVQAMRLPELIKGDSIDLETGAEIKQYEIFEALLKYGKLVEIFLDMDTGTISMTYKEYLELPATFIIARRIFKHTIEQMKEKKK
jgi:hypothetical protein